MLAELEGGEQELCEPGENAAHPHCIDPPAIHRCRELRDIPWRWGTSLDTERKKRIIEEVWTHEHLIMCKLHVIMCVASIKSYTLSFWYSAKHSSLLLLFFLFSFLVCSFSWLLIARKPLKAPRKIKTWARSRYAMTYLNNTNYLESHSWKTTK